MLMTCVPFQIVSYGYGRYKMRKEPSPAKRCEKSGKDVKRAML